MASNISQYTYNIQSTHPHDSPYLAQTPVSEPDQPILDALLETWQRTQEKSDLIAYLNLAVGTNNFKTPLEEVAKGFRKFANDEELRQLQLRLLIRSQDSHFALIICKELLNKETRLGPEYRNINLFVINMMAHLHHYRYCKQEEFLEFAKNAIQDHLGHLRFASAALKAIVGCPLTPEINSLLLEGTQKGFPLVELAYLYESSQDPEWKKYFTIFSNKEFKLPIEFATEALVAGIKAGLYDEVNHWIDINQNKLIGNCEILFFKATIAHLQNDLVKLEHISKELEAHYYNQHHTQFSPNLILFLSNRSRYNLMRLFAEKTNNSSTLPLFTNLCDTILETGMADFLYESCNLHYPDDPLLWSKRCITFTLNNQLNGQSTEESVIALNTQLNAYVTKTQETLSSHKQDIDAVKTRDLVQLNLAYAFQTYGRFPEAFDALKLVSDCIELYRLRGICYLSTGKLSEALEDANQALRINPRDTSLWKFRAQVAKELGNPEIELESIDQMIQLIPYDLNVWITKSDFLCNCERFTEAWNVLNQLEEKFVVREYFTKRRFHIAEEAFDCLDCVDKKSVEEAKKLAKYLDPHSNQSAETVLSRVIYTKGQRLLGDPEFKENPENLYIYAKAAGILGKRAEAITLTKQLEGKLKDSDKEIDRLFILSQNLLYNRDNEAIVISDRLCSLSNKIKFKYQRINILLNQKNYREAKERILELDRFPNKELVLRLIDQYHAPEHKSIRQYEEQIAKIIDLEDKTELKCARRVLMYRARERNYSNALSSKIDQTPHKVSLLEMCKLILPNKSLKRSQTYNFERRTSIEHIGAPTSLLKAGVDCETQIPARINSLKDVDVAAHLKYLLLGEELPSNVKYALGKMTPEQFLAALTPIELNLKQILIEVLTDKPFNSTLIDKIYSLELPEPLSQLLEDAKGFTAPIWLPAKSYDKKALKMQTITFLLQETPSAVEENPKVPKNINQKFKAELEIFKRLLDRGETRGAMMSLYILIKLYPESGEKVPFIEFLSKQVENPLDLSLDFLLRVKDLFKL